MFYVHPWELDPGHPRVKVRPFLRFRHYLRLGKTEAVVERVLASGQWVGVREAMEAADPPVRPVQARASMTTLHAGRARGVARARRSMEANDR